MHWEQWYQYATAEPSGQRVLQEQRDHWVTTTGTKLKWFHLSCKAVGPLNSSVYERDCHICDVLITVTFSFLLFVVCTFVVF